MAQWTAKRLMGRCANGCERDSGRIYHAVIGVKAVCGVTYGRRSAGWADPDGYEKVTCPRCIKKLRKTIAPDLLACLIACRDQLAEYVKEYGGCDHSVGICMCRDISVVAEASELICIASEPIEAA